MEFLDYLKHFPSLKSQGMGLSLYFENDPQICYYTILPQKSFAFYRSISLVFDQVAENYLKVVDAAQMKVSNLSHAENKDTLVSYGNTYLNAFESLVSALVKPTETHNLQNISLDNTGKKPCYVPVCTCVFDRFQKQSSVGCESLSNMFFWRSPALSEWFSFIIG